MWFGVDYYPEQWAPSMLEQDLDNIQELGCNAIRIAEFGWHIMEPAEGRFDFSFFDHVIRRAKARGLRIVMGTPTATIPAWLAKKHPDILSEFEDGTKRTFGGRHVYCLRRRPRAADHRPQGGGFRRHDPRAVARAQRQGTL